MAIIIPSSVWEERFVSCYNNNDSNSMILVALGRNEFRNMLRVHKIHFQFASSDDERNTLSLDAWHAHKYLWWWWWNMVVRWFSLSLFFSFCCLQKGKAEAGGKECVCERSIIKPHLFIVSRHTRNTTFFKIHYTRKNNLCLSSLLWRQQKKRVTDAMIQEIRRQQQDFIRFPC